MVLELRMAIAVRAADMCHCKHERRYHDSCTLCNCPFFVPASKDAISPEARKLWKAGHRARTLREGAK